MPSPHTDMLNIYQGTGKIEIMNRETNHQDGFSLYICTPIPFSTNKDEQPSLIPEIRFKVHKRLAGRSINQEIRQKNSAFCFELIMNILNQVLFSDIQIKKQRHTCFINSLWEGLNDTHKKEIIAAIYEKKPSSLHNKAIISKTIMSGSHTQEFFDLLCQNHPLPYPNTVTAPNAAHVLYISSKDLRSREGMQSIALYTQKHPHQCCIVTKKNVLEQVLKQHQEQQQTMTLVIFAHNNINKQQGFLDWTLATAGEELGKLLNKYSCIGHFNMFTCHSIALNKEQLKPALLYEKSTGKQDLSRSLSIYPGNFVVGENPFTKKTLAHQIYHVVAPGIHNQERSPLTMTFSPLYILPHNNRFIGSSHEYKYYFAEEDPLLHYKKITSFIGKTHLFKGVCLEKSKRHQTKRYPALLDNNEIIPKTLLSTPCVFFKKHTSPNDPCPQLQEQVQHDKAPVTEDPCAVHLNTTISKTSV